MFTKRKKEANEICEHFSVDIFFHPVCEAPENMRDECRMHAIEEGIAGFSPEGADIERFVLHRCEKLRHLCDNTGHLSAEIALKYCEQIETDKIAGVSYNFINDETRIHTKVSRNDPCPCGSGKKYKHCCGR